VSGVIAYAGETLDNGGHSRQGPQVGTEAVMTGSFAECQFDALPLASMQPWHSARAARSLQGLPTRLFPAPIPAGHTHAAGFQLPSHGSQDDLAFGEQAGGLFAAPFKGLEIARRHPSNKSNNHRP
jgi:hypothetical protein